MWSELRKPKTMGPLPRELQPNDISLFVSLVIGFFEALFTLLWQKHYLTSNEILDHYM